MIDAIFDPIRRFVTRLDRDILKTIDKINAQEFVFFTKGDNIASLNRVLLYISRNEHTKKLKIVNVYQDPSEVPSQTGGGN
ncbi:MAG: hypothetical protein R3B47_21015 [Bacteroidia bacterium]